MKYLIILTLAITFSLLTIAFLFMGLHFEGTVNHIVSACGIIASLGGFVMLFDVIEEKQ